MKNKAEFRGLRAETTEPQREEGCQRHLPVEPDSRCKPLPCVASLWESYGRCVTKTPRTLPRQLKAWPVSRDNGFLSLKVVRRGTCCQTGLSPLKLKCVSLENHKSYWAQTPLRPNPHNSCCSSRGGSANEQSYWELWT